MTKLLQPIYLNKDYPAAIFTHPGAVVKGIGGAAFFEVDQIGDLLNIEKLKECVAVCPQQDCLTLTGPNGKKIPLFILPAALLALFLSFWFFADINGYWHTSMSLDEMRKLYRQISEVAHPGR